MDKERAPVFSVRNLTKHFGSEKDGNRVDVIKDISMNIHEKEFIVILGNSGSGKSTFLKMLGGIQPASGGSIILNGKDCQTQVPREDLRRFGFVFQSNNLLNWKTAEGNLGFMLKTMKLTDEKWKLRIDEMLEIVGLLNYKRVYPHELSGGMKQRVGIARALVHDPDILILDQPLGALDAITRKMLAYELLNIWKKTQKTIIMVTNNVDEAILLASRVFIFSDKPAVITHEIKIGIPIEERETNVDDNKRYNELRDQINAIVRTSMTGRRES